MLFLVACLCCAVAAHAVPQGYVPGLNLNYAGGRQNDVLGYLGLNYGRGLNSGSNYGNRGSVSRNDGYLASGYGSTGGSNVYDQGHTNRHYMKITESDVSGAHNAGASQNFGRQGYGRGGSSSYGADEANYGGGYYGLGGFKAKVKPST